MRSATKLVALATVILLAGTLQGCMSKAKFRAEIEKRGIPYTTDAFFNAVTAKQNDLVELFLGSGFDANTCKPATSADQLNETAMTIAIAEEDLATAKLLLKNGYQPNQEQCSVKTPPLHYAAMVGNVPLAKLLVKNGADVNRKDAFGITPLNLAMSMRHPDMVEYLKSVGAR